MQKVLCVMLGLRQVARLGCRVGALGRRWDGGLLCSRLQSTSNDHLVVEYLQNDQRGMVPSVLDAIAKCKLLVCFRDCRVCVQPPGSEERYQQKADPAGELLNPQ